MPPQVDNKEFNLDGGTRLWVKATGANGIDPAKVEFWILDCFIGSLFLHWGFIKDGEREWHLPKQCAEGTRNYKNRALQTPFSKATDATFLTIDIVDNQVIAIEFVLRDESSDRWMKLNGGNFRVGIPRPHADFSSQMITTPEELVKAQADLRQERNGRHSYSLEKQQDTKEFNLDGGTRLWVKATGANGIDPAKVDFQIPDCSIGSLFLHWGFIKAGERKWHFPKLWAEGTRNYKNRALQTPFTKAEDAAFLTINIVDNQVLAIEFVLKDESSDRWITLHGGNIHVGIPRPHTDFSSQMITIPEELVKAQAYIRWERNGRQNYSLEKQQLEYEEARKELQLNVSHGASLQSLKANLLGTDDTNSKGFPNTGLKVPVDLVRAQAYIRWEKAGKPNYSLEDQQREFEAARREVEEAVHNGVPLESLQKHLQPKSKSSRVTSEAPRTHQNACHTWRKKRELSDIINNVSLIKVSTKEPTLLELGAQVVEGADKGAVLMRKFWKIGEHDLLVFVTNLEGEVRVRFATNMTDPISLHWAVSENSDREWQTPHTIIPPNSVVLQGACESCFHKGFAGEPTLQSVEIFIGNVGIRGLPFVIRSSDKWYKNNGVDFYIPLSGELFKPEQALKDFKCVSKWLLDEIAIKESDAERSLMHRFNIAADIAQRVKSEGELELAGLLVWMRFMVTRQLTWNKNYNVKPREISAAQDHFTNILTDLYRNQPQNREITRLIMSTVGRGGQGDVGQRIRDEILVIQRNNNCKGGMMEEWHQKLHNNSSPDDVVICQALLDYIRNNFNMEVYWKTLNSNGVSKQRLASYDRPIVSEPCFSPNQKEGLLRDLGAYLKTLKAVHSGADLDSAISNCMGYNKQGEDFMKSVNIHSISGLSQQLPGLLQFVLQHVEDKQVILLLEGLLEARAELRPALLKNHDRLKDIIFLDLALDSAVRTAVERQLECFRSAKPEDIIQVISLVVENLCLSLDNNEEFVYCLKDWHSLSDLDNIGKERWVLRAKAILDRTRLALADKAEQYTDIYQCSAIYLGGLLGCQKWAVDMFSEEVIRAGSAAALSQLLNCLDPILRSSANLGSWQVISMVEVRGYLTITEDLGNVQEKVYSRPTIIVANRVRGEEEIPDGAVAVLTPDMPDLLSHISVRARNSKVCFATCFDLDILSDLRTMEGRALKLQPTLADISFSEICGEDIFISPSEAALGERFPPTITLQKKEFGGKFAVMENEFNSVRVGAKSCNIAHLKRMMPASIKIPTSVAVPFRVFEKVLAIEKNKDVAKEIEYLINFLAHGDTSKLQDIRTTVLKLQAPPELVEEFKVTMRNAGMPWPQVEGKEQWEQVWTAIKKVWASKWNERAYLSTRKAKIDHNDLCMAVLVQEIVRADYAFVIHTTNPSNCDASEIYAEVVKGWGETLVGAYPGRALSFIVKKSDMKSPKVTAFPSKRMGLFLKESIIFRSDSNGEDLEGYAGAGLYDSVPMDEVEARVIDYSSDPLVVDENFQKFVLTKIAEAGAAVEKLYGGIAQDIEGVIKDKELYIVQTRPQM